MDEADHKKTGDPLANERAAIGREPDTNEEVWSGRDETLARRDARILFPDLCRGRTATRGNGYRDVDTDDRKNPFISIPGYGGFQWSEGNKVIDDAYPDYTPPEPYDFEKEFANFDPKNLHSAHHRADFDKEDPEARRLAIEAELAGLNIRKTRKGMFLTAKLPDRGSSTRKESMASDEQSSVFPPAPGRYPSLSSDGRSRLESSIQSSGDEHSPMEEKKANSMNKNANGTAEKKTSDGAERLASTASVSWGDLVDDSTYPPTPGAPSDLDAEKDGDVNMDVAEPAKVSTGPLPTPEGRDELVKKETDVETSERTQEEPADASAERPEKIDAKGADADLTKYLEYVAEDVVMEESSVETTHNNENALTEQHKQIKSQHGKGVQKHHPLPPLPFAAPARLSDTSPILEIPAPSSSLAAGPAIDAKSSKIKFAPKDLIHNTGSIDRIDQSSQGPARKDSSGQHKESRATPASTPPSFKKYSQVSAASSPTTTDSQLKQLQRSVTMGRKGSFSEAKASSAENIPKPKPKGRLSGKSGIMSLEDVDLVDSFVFIEQKDVEELRAAELHTRIRGIESLRRWHNGVPKKSMVDVFMKWQRNMRTLKAEKVEAEEGSQAAVFASEEEEDIDAEGSTDEEYFEAQENPVTGKNTQEHPLKSPFSNQPRPGKQSPFVAKLKAETSFDSKKVVSSPTREYEPEYYKEFEKEQEVERKRKSEEKMGMETERKNKRARRSASRPASYKV